jgi:hypothetical protein
MVTSTIHSVQNGLLETLIAPLTMARILAGTSQKVNKRRLRATLKLLRIKVAVRRSLNSSFRLNSSSVSNPRKPSLTLALRSSSKNWQTR